MRHNHCMNRTALYDCVRVRSGQTATRWQRQSCIFLGKHHIRPPIQLCNFKSSVWLVKLILIDFYCPLPYNRTVAYCGREWLLGWGKKQALWLEDGISISCPTQSLGLAFSELHNRSVPRGNIRILQLELVLKLPPQPKAWMTFSQRRSRSSSNIIAIERSRDRCQHL